MIYRMKQNAVGLANICVLSTMVLVILSTTVSLYIGSDEEIINRYPYDCSIYINTNKDSVLQEDIQQIVTETAEAEGVHVSKNEKSCFGWYLLFVKYRVVSRVQSIQRGRIN